MASSQKSLLPGFILIALGILLLLPKFTDISMHHLWPLVVLGGGILFFVGFFINRSDYGLLMPGTILTVTGLVFLYCTFEGWYIMRDLWPFFLVAPGLGFALMYLFGKKEQGLLIPGGILLGLGALFLVGRTGFDYLLAVVFIIIGLLFLLTSRKN
jgi:hypothetical protein